MKKLLALLVVCCLLVSFSYAYALTMEQVVFSELPKMIVQSLDGFDVLYQDDIGQKEIAFVYDEAGRPMLLWGESDEDSSAVTGLKLGTIVETLFCYAAGVDTLPEGAPADLSFLLEMVPQIKEALIQAVSIEKQSAPMEDENSLQRMNIIISPRKLLVAIDELVKAQITEHTDQIDYFLNRYSELISKTIPQGTAINHSSDLLSLWNEMELSALLPIEVPLKVQVSATGTLAEPWHVDANAAGISFTADYSGEYLSASLNAWQTRYDFDSRDLSKLWEIISNAWNGISTNAFSFSISEEKLYLKLDARLLLNEFKTELMASMQNSQYTHELLLRYMPWFGNDEKNEYELERKFHEDLNNICFELNYIKLPTIEIQANANGYLLEFRVSYNAVSMHINLSPSTIDLLLPFSGGLLKVNGTLNEKAFSLSGTFGDDIFLASGTYENNQWSIRLFADDDAIADITITDSCARIYDASDAELLLSIIWSNNSFQLIGEDGINLFLACNGKCVTWSFGEASSPIYSGSCSWDQELAFDMEILNTRHSRYSNQYPYITKQLHFLLAPEYFEAEYCSTPLYGRTYKHCALVNWSKKNPRLQLSYHVDSPQYAITPIIYSLDYRPGHLEGCINGRSLLISSNTSKDGATNQMQVTRTILKQLMHWNIETLIHGNQWNIVITGDNNVEIRLSTSLPPVTNKELQKLNIKLLTVHDILVLLGLDHSNANQWIAAEAQGFAGPVSVRVLLDADKTISVVEIGDENFAETVGFGAKALEEEFQSQFIGKVLPLSSDEIDGIAGATITTNAVMEALNSIAESVTIPVEKSIPATEVVQTTSEVLTGSAQGFAGPVTVKVTLSNNKITAIQIGDEHFVETPGFGARALEDTFQTQFVGKTLPLVLDDIDALSGATITTNAVVEAINSVID